MSPIVHCARQDEGHFLSSCVATLSADKCDRLDRSRPYKCFLVGYSEPIRGAKNFWDQQKESLHSIANLTVE